MAVIDPGGPVKGVARSLTPTANEFIPIPFKSQSQVLDATFVTQTIPDVPATAGVIALCAVPEALATMEEMGWNVSDFLAFKSLVCGQNHDQSQEWLSMCDIEAVLERHPELGNHGTGDRRVVSEASKPKTHTRYGVEQARKDNVQTYTSITDIKTKFVEAAKEKIKICKARGYPVVFIVCGLTSLQQDVYLGSLEEQWSFTDIRADLGEGLNGVQATFITPSLFSAGWQVNPMFGGRPFPLRAGRNDFLARQFGGLLAKDLVVNYFGWHCPMLDLGKVDMSVRVKLGAKPTPLLADPFLNGLILKIELLLHSRLSGRCTRNPNDHSFSFDIKNDEWSQLITDRRGPKLDQYAKKWDKLPRATGQIQTGLYFLGSAFGGSVASQISHIRFLTEESFLAWPGHWARQFGEDTKKAMERFMKMKDPDLLDCHEMFNILEHRATTSVLGDRIVQYFNLPVPNNQRCRDWDCLEWTKETSKEDQASITKFFGPVLTGVPRPTAPPGMNSNPMSKVQTRLETAITYVRAALGLRWSTSPAISHVAVARIDDFVHEIRTKQAELLAGDPKVYEEILSWLRAIGMPARTAEKAIIEASNPRGVSLLKAPDMIVDDADYEVILDSDEERPASTDNHNITMKQDTSSNRVEVDLQEEDHWEEDTKQLAPSDPIPEPESPVRKPQLEDHWGGDSNLKSSLPVQTQPKETPQAAESASGVDDIGRQQFLAICTQHNITVKEALKYFGEMGRNKLEAETNETRREVSQPVEFVAAVSRPPAENSVVRAQYTGEEIPNGKGKERRQEQSPVMVQDTPRETAKPSDTGVRTPLKVPGVPPHLWGKHRESSPVTPVLTPRTNDGSGPPGSGRQTPPHLRRRG
ncbi:hypothetical protein GGR57DRAFT_252582 [Xylariaceae sp. FL1272]|nr:hypothetical protein GGR57DRAFT_252582 [Xylariaceae sp. FL1272]